MTAPTSSCSRVARSVNRERGIVSTIRWVGILVLWIVALSQNSALAQTAPVTSQSGFQPNRDYLSLQPWESIDTASGNVMLTFTDLQLPGNNGRELAFQRRFSNIYPSDVPSRWRFAISGLPMRVTITPDVQTGQNPTGMFPNEESVWTPKFILADGSRTSTYWLVAPDTSSDASTAETTEWVVTPNFWRYSRKYRNLRLPDGTSAYYDASGRLSNFYDPFGNVVTLTWSPGALRVVQQLGNSQSREIDFVMDDRYELPTRMSFEGKIWSFAFHPAWE